MKYSPVIAIELGAADLNLIEGWIAQGHLKNLSRLLEQGASGRLENLDYYTTETKWTTFLTGCMPQTTGYWGPLKFHPGTYDMERKRRSYDFQQFPPFYTAAADAQIAVFDLPQTVISDKIRGMQVIGWGAHAPYVANSSSPPELLDHLSSKFGEHPTFRRDYIDNWWNPETVTGFCEKLKTGIRRRAEICKFMLRQQEWDLFLTGFSETHPAGHHYYHLSQPEHPLFSQKDTHGQVKDLMLDLYKVADSAIGEIIDAASDSAQVLIYSLQGMMNNSTDLPSMVFLPELLYRYSFPGQFAMAPGKPGSLSSPIVPALNSASWASEVWNLTTSSELNSPAELYQQESLYAWQPTMWYKPLWPHMKAFALPTFAVEGFIRINLKGREPEGIVEPADYHAVCDELTQHLYELKDSRTGRPIIKKVVRTRQDPLDSSLNLPNADLVTVMADCPSDVVDSAAFGRIGPIPYHRTGGHPPEGFLIAQGAGIAPNTELPEGHVVDLPPTILKLMGVAVPQYCEGQSLL